MAASHGDVIRGLELRLVPGVGSFAYYTAITAIRTSATTRRPLSTTAPPTRCGERRSPPMVAGGRPGVKVQLTADGRPSRHHKTGHTALVPRCIPRKSGNRKIGKSVYRLFGTSARL